MSIRCLGWSRPCGRPVDPKRGGAWCSEHAPVDLTGDQWDAARLLDVRDADRKVRVWTRRRRGAV